MVTMIDFMTWRHRDYFKKDRSYKQYHKEYFYKNTPFLEENLKLKSAECVRDLFLFYVPERKMTEFCIDHEWKEDYSTVDDQEEEYYDDDGEHSLLYFHSFVNALTNLYIFDLGFLSAYKMEGEKVNFCPFTEQFRSFWECYPETGVLKKYGEKLCKCQQIYTCQELYKHSYDEQRCHGSRQHKILRCYLKHFYGDVQQLKTNGTWSQTCKKYDVSFKIDIFKFDVPR
jgi:hypothetical protein